MRTLALLCLALTATTADAEGLDINLSGQALRGLYAGSLSNLFPRVNGVYELGAIVGEEDERDFVQAHAGLLATGDAGAAQANVIAGLGGRVAVLDNDGVTGGALALGGMFEGRLPAFNRIGAIAYAYGAPKASSFGDLEGYLEYAFGIDYQVLQTASVYAGFRQLKIDAKGLGELTVDNGWHLGLRLNF
jgi:hypothetical protein